MKTRLPKYRLSLPLSLLAAVGLAGCITLLALWCQPNAFRGVISNFLHKPVLILLNALPVGLLLLGLAFLFRSVFFGAALTNLIVCGLSIASRVKIEVRDEPVFPRDLTLLKEVSSAVESYDIRYPAAAIAIVVLATAALAALGVFVGHRPLPWEKLRGWRGSLLGTAGSFAALALAVVTVLGSTELYDSIGASNPYRLSTVFNENGFPYNFCHQFTTFPVDRPQGFSRSEAAAWDEQETAGGRGRQVHLIMVMNEAFSDITDAPAFTWDADPLPNLHALQKDPRAISGRIVVPGFAGGTANTEFDVLTGMQTNALSAATTSALRVVNRNLDSVFRVFGEEGYHTSFFHPGDDWFYNRENVYRWMGAEETVFADEMEDLEYKGRWVTDSYMAAFIEKKFEEAVASGRMLCNYTTTIQNHMSYTADKYGADYDFPPVTASGLSEEVETMLAVYAEGARDADAMLGRLVSYFSDTDQPVVLAFWGDHLPYLGDNQIGYRQLGLDVFSGPEGQENLAAYETPYVVWANDAAAEVLDWENAVKALDLGPDGRLSACFLGAALLELTGRGEATPWFSFLNQLRRQVPVVQKSVCLSADGGAFTEPAGELAADIAKWRQWSYYKLKYKEIRP
ncbi:LTA synthase family protein [Oscillibacter sp.]|uniref:LTA synthase family protein n=1 Tax=Oscillibacter sp. TaxID=1945593 RepID=UPI002172697E|nr:LTA synthase family protein [Oscillibacter sp.]MCI9648690.1 LTA synthase family protein [Oscillibacter sp.]